MSTTQLPLPNVGIRPTRSRFQKILDYINKHYLDVQFADGCCEPGYDDKPVALGDWNESNYSLMPRLAKVLEKMGYAVEWLDEWVVCDCCGKAVRSQADSCSWKRYLFQSEYGEITCGDCTKDDPADYLKHLSGNAQSCLTFDIDLSKYGYELHEESFENGWYGQEDDPKVIAKQLREEGITDFIFVLDSKGQFDISFSVWVKK